MIIVSLFEHPQVEMEFKFGKCARFGLRKVHRFFGDSTIPKCGLGFQNPQVITYDLRRDRSGSTSLSVEDSTGSEPIHVDLGCDLATRVWKGESESDTG